MNVCSIDFLLLLIFAPVVFFWLPTVRTRQTFLALANAGFLYTLLPEARDWWALGLFVTSGYVIAKLLQVWSRRWILATYVTLLIAVFLVLKRYEFLALVLPTSLFAYTVSIVGLSYMLFRQIHVAVDVLQGQIEGLSPWTYLNYQLNLFGLLAGPIQRYQEFARDWDRLEPATSDPYDILWAYRRIFYGIIKVAVVGALCLFYYERFATRFLDNRWRFTGMDSARVMVLFYFYPAYIYFNFSGYCDIVIGGASLFGIRMPENFNFPFLARNMIDYWTRFHQTLGLWIRDYIFTPLYMTVAMRWAAQAASLAFLCYFVAFFLAGMWHGSTWNFVMYGLLNGIGVAATKLWETWLIKRRGRQGFKSYLQSQSIRAMAVIGTFHYVCLTVLFFPGDIHKTLTILTNLAARHG
jgi:alginate O-acetyltransferase complex protein AlgI